MRSESTRFFGQPRLTNAYVPLAAVMRTRRFGGNPGRKAKTGQATHQPGGNYIQYSFIAEDAETRQAAPAEGARMIGETSEVEDFRSPFNRDSGNNYNPARARFGIV